MSLVAVGSAKGSPGATTLVAALASRWPGPRQVLVAELDPAGGDLGIRLGLPAGRGLVTLAAEGRRRVTPELVWDHAFPFPGSDVAHVLPGPASADQATAALAAVGPTLAGALADLDGTDVLADCGRLDPGSPAMAVAQRADLVVMVARPSVAEIRHLSARVAALRLGVPVGLVLVGDRPYGVSEVATAVGIDALGAVAHDERGAELVGRGAHGRSRLARTSALLRTSRSLAEAVVAHLGSSSTPVATPPVFSQAAAPAPAPAPGAPFEPAPEPAPAPEPSATLVPAAPPEPAGDGSPPAEPHGPRPGGSLSEDVAEEPSPARRRRRPPLAGGPRRARPLQPRSRMAEGPDDREPHDVEATLPHQGGDR